MQLYPNDKICALARLNYSTIMRLLLYCSYKHLSRCSVGERPKHKKLQFDNSWYSSSSNFCRHYTTVQTCHLCCVSNSTIMFIIYIK